MKLTGRQYATSMEHLAPQRAIVDESLAMEHYRLHVIEQWPEGPNRDASLASVRSALEALNRADSPVAAPWKCIECVRAACEADRKPSHPPRRSALV